ncbi:MAG: hypothetical protein LBM04_10725 [Opitutaceae bacterium]|nr:hypothetical protein [Opitutaceae bacterium]
MFPKTPLPGRFHFSPMVEMKKRLRFPFVSVRFPVSAYIYRQRETKPEKGGFCHA